MRSTSDGDGRCKVQVSSTLGPALSHVRSHALPRLRLRAPSRLGTGPAPSSPDAWRRFALSFRSIPPYDSTTGSAPPSLSLPDIIQAVDSMGGITALLCAQQRPAAVPAREEEAQTIREVEGLESFGEAAALGLSRLFDRTASNTTKTCCAPRAEGGPSKRLKGGACSGASAARTTQDAEVSVDQAEPTVRSLMVGPAHALAVLFHACQQEVCDTPSPPAALPARAQTEVDAVRVKLNALSQPTTPLPK